MDNNKNIVLIGMPGVGKSTLGVLLAKATSRNFIDTDVYIQHQEGVRLQHVIDTKGLNEFCKKEEYHILSLDCKSTVIATGGSAVYSERAMAHLLNLSKVIFLKVDYKEIKKRIHNFETRGIAKAENQTFRDLFNERQILYNKYAELTIDCNDLDQEEIAEIISKKIF